MRVGAVGDVRAPWFGPHGMIAHPGGGLTGSEVTVPRGREPMRLSDCEVIGVAESRRPSSNLGVGLGAAQADMAATPRADDLAANPRPNLPPTRSCGVPP